MKRLLFSAVTLDVGGIETALVTLLNYLAKQKEKEEYKYEITLVLEKKQGLFLDVLDKNIRIIEYSSNDSKVVLIRKAINLLKQISFKIKYKNKYDFSCSYATYSNPGAFVARTASKNSALWCHLDYLAFFEGDKNKTKEFFEEKHYKKFKNIIAVSQESKNTFLEVFPKEEGRIIYINNLIDSNKILKQSEESIKDVEEEENIVTFINVGRHEEKQKKLTRIIEAAKILKDKTDKEFRILFIGDGQDTEKYKELVSKYNMAKEIIFLGRKKNPYPYIKMSNCTILSSDYEGYPVAFVESMVLNKPIITTEVSGAEAIKKEKYAIITQKTSEAICQAMKQFIEEGFEITNKFNPEEYNKQILMKLEEIF